MFFGLTTNFPRCFSLALPIHSRGASGMETDAPGCLTKQCSTSHANRSTAFWEILFLVQAINAVDDLRTWHQISSISAIEKTFVKRQL